MRTRRDCGRIAVEAHFGGAQQQLPLPRHDEHGAAIARAFQVVDAGLRRPVQNQVRALHEFERRHRHLGVTRWATLRPTDLRR